LKYTIANYKDEPRDFPNIYLIRIFSAISISDNWHYVNNYNEIEIDFIVNSVSFPYTIIPWKHNLYHAHRHGSRISPDLRKYGYTTSGGAQFNQKCLGV
jgi:hypothetical protein